MTERVDFYVLKSATVAQRANFACRLTEKAYLRDLRIVILSETLADAQALDDMLWTFSERSFVPHAISDARSDATTPVQLTADLDAIEGADLLVNLSGRLPTRVERFARVAEIIDGDDDCRRLGRERFKIYRDELKLPIETHQLDEAAAV